jgi:hypothetical protein
MDKLPTFSNFRCSLVQIPLVDAGGLVPWSRPPAGGLEGRESFRRDPISVDAVSMHGLDQPKIEEALVWFAAG